MDDGVQVRCGHATPLLLGDRWTATCRSNGSQRLRSLSMPGLVAIIYYSVAGGPFGTEDVISAAGPLLGLLGFLLMPAVWSVPEALVAAELATTFPSNGGYVTWVTAAFGPFWGFLEGFLSWTSGVSDNAIYPVLFCDYLKHVIPATAVGWPRILCVVTFTLVLSWLNYLGLSIMGWSAVMLAIFTVLPFLYVVPMCLPRVELANLLVVPTAQEMDWQKYLNVLFWNLNYWDSASTLAGEVFEPRRVLECQAAMPSWNGGIGAVVPYPWWASKREESL
eukprot:symbB.v1.2.001393.t1/scaffold67.1/size356791/19